MAFASNFCVNLTQVLSWLQVIQANIGSEVHVLKMTLGLVGMNMKRTYHTGCPISVNFATHESRNELLFVVNKKALSQYDSSKSSILGSLFG